jgi:hypothetical protein
VFNHRQLVGPCDSDVPLLFVTQVSVERLYVTHLANTDKRWLYTTRRLQLQVVLHWTEGADYLALDEYFAYAAVCRLDIGKEGKRTWLFQRAERSSQVDCGYVVISAGCTEFPGTS